MAVDCCMDCIKSASCAICLPLGILRLALAHKESCERHMSTSDQPNPVASPGLQPRVAQVLQLNRNHQQALRTYIADLQSKLVQAEGLFVGQSLTSEYNRLIT